MGFTDVAHLELGVKGWSKQNSVVEDFASKSRWVRKPTEESAS